MPRPNKEQEEINYNLAVQQQEILKEVLRYENFLQDIKDADIIAADEVALVYTNIYLVLKHFVICVGRDTTGIGKFAPEAGKWSFSADGESNSFKRYRMFEAEDVMYRFGAGTAADDPLDVYTKGIYYNRNLMQWEGISIVTGAIENLFTVDRRVGWSEVGTNFGIHGWSQDTTDNETLDTVYRVWKWVERYFFMLGRSGDFSLSFPVETSNIENEEKNEVFEYYAGLAPNMEFKRTQGFTLGFDSGHSFYIPLGYAIDNDSTMMLHRRFPEIQDQFMIIRRIHGTMLEDIVPSALGFITTAITGSKGAGTFTTRVYTEVAKDRFGYLFPYIYSAAWSTYVHYDYPDYEWIDRIGDPAVMFTRASVYTLIYPGGLIYVRNHLDDKTDNLFYKNINRTYPRNYIWTRGQLDEIFGILEKYPDFNEQLQNVQKSTPLGYDPMGGRQYIAPDNSGSDISETWGFRDVEDQINDAWSDWKQQLYDSVGGGTGVQVPGENLNQPYKMTDNLTGIVYYWDSEINEWIEESEWFS